MLRGASRAISTPTWTPEARGFSPTYANRRALDPESTLKATSGMPARAAASAVRRERRARRRSRRRSRRPSSRSPSAAPCSVSLTLRRAASRSTASCTGRAQRRPARRTGWRRAAGRACSWLTNTNRQRGCAGKSPPPSPARAAAGPRQLGEREAGRSGAGATEKVRAIGHPPVLQEDPADDAVALAHQRECVLEPLGREAARRRPARSRRGRRRAVDDARPDGGRVADAADQLEVAEDEAVGGERSARAPAPAIPSATMRPPIARQPRRELDRGDGARRLDHEVELALVCRRPAGDVDGLGRRRAAGPARARPRARRRRRSRRARTAARARA